MEDLLNAHADRIRAANEHHRSKAERIRSKAAAGINSELDKFRKSLAAMLKAFDSAREDTLTAMDAITSDAGRELDEAFDESCLAIVASESILASAMQERQHFYVTGKLPEPPKMPSVADAPQLGAANDQAPNATERAAA